MAQFAYAVPYSRKLWQISIIKYFQGIQFQGYLVVYHITGGRQKFWKNQ